jgi:hypothetical protein
MYYPYLRGKQNELILLRENAQLVAKSNFVPIIEPVKSNLNPLNKCIDVLIAFESSFILIANPKCGDLESEYQTIENDLLTDELLKYPNLVIGYICDENTVLDQLSEFLEKYSHNKVALIHYGFGNGKKLSQTISDFKNICTHVFIEDHAQKRYRKNFNSGAARVLVRDGFHKRPNREHPKVEHFSELHIMYTEENMDGFGDFVISGDEYSESGGPAYAVAIHLTYLDDDDEDDMFIKHYVSDRNSTPADPGGKFLEALKKLVVDVDADGKMYQSDAVKEYKALYARSHFPGLGVVKKLSMQHHIQLLSEFLK